MTWDTTSDLVLVNLEFFYVLYTRHTSLLQMKKCSLSILCTAYCNTIMPQIEYNVDNICKTVIMKVVIICMKGS